MVSVITAYARVAAAIASEFLPVQAFRCVFDRDFERRARVAGAQADAAEGLAEREAQVEVGAPDTLLRKCASPTCGCQDDDRYRPRDELAGSVKCPIGGTCPSECDRTEPGCVNIWGPASDHTEALRRNDPRYCGPCDEYHELPSDEGPAVASVQVTVHNPALEMHNEFDELCAYAADDAVADAVCGVCRPVRDLIEQMIEERFGPQERVSGGHDGPASGETLRAQLAKCQVSTRPTLPNAAVPETAAAGPSADDGWTPDSPAEGQPNWVDWASPAICEVLAEHQMLDDDERYICRSPGELSHASLYAQDEWREHVAPLIAEHLQKAARAHDSARHRRNAEAAALFPQYQKK